MSCQICNLHYKCEPHFGGICCRACAAFFRRFVHSKKMNVCCTCERSNNTYPCRKCRMEKCLQAGMKVAKVQSQREPNSKKATCSELEYPIPCRSIQRLQTNDWQILQADRISLYGDTQSLYEFTRLTKSDINLTLSFINKYVPEFKQLSSIDKQQLVNNSYSKWILLDSVIEVSERKPWTYQSGSAITNQEIVTFYGPCDSYETDIIRNFDPYWNYYYHRLLLPLIDRNFDASEYIAIFLLLLFDPAYINLSDNCVELCHNMRKVILRELRGYQMERDYGDLRLFDTLECMSMLERADVKFQEEIIQCELNGILLDDEFRRLFCRNNI